MANSIDEGFAAVLAGMVSVGLTPGDEELPRARVSLQAIGLMLVNADRDNQRVREILEFPAQGVIRRNADGSISITISEPDVPSA